MYGIVNVCKKLNKLGLIPLGQLEITPGEWRILIANAGPLWFETFARSWQAKDGNPHPMDRYTKEVIAYAAPDYKALFPFEGPPYPPFITWAIKAKIGYKSVLGPIIHPHYGLWHGYRAAFCSHKPWAPECFPAHQNGAHSPCDTCNDKPCLKTCPVGAFTKDSYDYPTCKTYLIKNGDCLKSGCEARRACPVGRKYDYSPTQHAFHMRACLS